MIHLPAEVSLLIFENLEKVDLKNVRLVHSYCCGLVTELLFDRIFISGRSKDLDVFTEWTNNKRCSVAVKELIFDATMMDPELSMIQYLKALWKFLHFYIVDRDYDLKGSTRAVQEILYHLESGLLLGPKEEMTFLSYPRWQDYSALHFDFENGPESALKQNPLVQDGYGLYVHEAEHERDTRISGELLVCLIEGFNRLPNVKCISFEGEPTEVLTTGVQFDPVCPKPLSISGTPFRRSWHPLYLLPTNRYGIDAEHDEGGIADISTITNKPNENFISQFKILVRAISMSSVNASHIKICLESVFGLPANDLSSFLASPRKMSSHLTQAFGELQSLILHLNDDDSAVNDWEPVVTFLLMIPSLRHLDLQLQYGLVTDWEIVPQLSQRFKLPQLRSLSLAGFYITSHALLTFLSSHHLERLELDDVTLVDDDWLGGFRAIYEVVVSMPKVRINMEARLNPNEGLQNEQHLTDVEIATSHIVSDFKGFACFFYEK